MTDVVLHSTQGMTDDDLEAIAPYLKALASDRPRGAPPPAVAAAEAPA